MKDKKLFFGFVALLLVVGLPLTLVSLMQQTNTENRAARHEPTLPQQSFTNLNNTADVEANNQDGTMGPLTAKGNWSNTVPYSLKGTLVFAVTDPQPIDPGSQGQKPTGVGNPEITHPVKPTRNLPTQAQETGNPNSNQLTALNLTITKVEVHLAYQGIPGSKATEIEKLTTTPGQNNQPMDHWETLVITSPVTIDLVQLAKTHDFSTLGLTKLAAGHYTEVRLYVTNATAMFNNSTIAVPLTIPGKDSIVKVVQSFNIVAGQTTKLTMDFDAQHSVVHAGDQYLLKPVIAHLFEEHQ